MSKFLLYKWFTQVHENLCYGIGVNQMGRYDVARKCILQKNKTLFYIKHLFNVIYM